MGGWRDFQKLELYQYHQKLHTENNHFSNGSKSFSCQYCQKVIWGTYALMMHEKTHTGEKPFCCKYCKKKFSREKDMKSHEITNF